MSIDLHLHSTYSDGTLSPAEIVEHGRKRGLRSLSLTDHDTIAGISEGAAAAARENIEMVSGVELSVEFGEVTFHLLGYFFDHEDTGLKGKIALLQQARDERNRKILSRLQARGIDISMEEVLKFSPVGQTGRPHIAQVLKEKGVVSNMNQAFRRFLGKGACAYVSRFVYSFDEAAAFLKESGGITVLAHPAQIDPTLHRLPGLVAQLAPRGLDGLEVYYPSQSSSIRKKLKAIAKRYSMVISGGSDYHGLIRPGTDMAGGAKFWVPGEVLEGMRQKASENRHIRDDI